MCIVPQSANFSTYLKQQTMARLMPVTRQTTETILQLYDNARGSWWGCNWHTQFGPKKLNLFNVKPHQARLIAEATSGEERDAWDSAALYLIRIDADAKFAEKTALQAIHLMNKEHWPEALAAIESAVRRESIHRESTTWRPIRDAIANACKDGQTLSHQN